MRQLREYHTGFPVESDLGNDRNNWPADYRLSINKALHRARDLYFVETRPLHSECRYVLFNGRTQWVLFVTEIEVPQCV